MISSWIFLILSLGYLGSLFLVAYIGDKYRSRESNTLKMRGWIYPLSLAVYCTSWTFFGSVGLASRSGYDFLAVYLGPIFVYTLLFPLLRRVIRLAKAQNISSAADFIGARYGKNPFVAALVAIISLILLCS
jgi:Na+/proline symporter